MTARLYEKRGTWHIVLIYRDQDSNRKQKWINTDLPIRGNTRKAKKLLDDAFIKWKPLLEPDIETEPDAETDVPGVTSKKTCDDKTEDSILFSEYLMEWLDSRRNRVQITTFGGYQQEIKIGIAPYFDKKKICVDEVTEDVISDFYRYKRRSGVSENTLLHYQTIMNQALRKAAREKLIQINPYMIMDKDQKPKRARYIPDTYNEHDLKKLFAALKDDPLALLILMDITYGLRRSELLGLRWSSIDFKQKTIHICFKVTEATVDGKTVCVMNEMMKNKTSNRTLPLVESIAEELLLQKHRQYHNKKLYGCSYDSRFQDFVFVNNLGQLYKPDYVSRHFQTILQKYNLKRIRFHDLRHTCATMLCRQKVSLQEIQIWLGHSTYQTTADIYTHLDYKDKMGTAFAAERIFTSVVNAEGGLSLSE